MSYQKLSHVVWDCKYHLVIVPKYRYKIFDTPLKIAVRNEIKKLCTWMKIPLHEGKVCDDHIHISIPPKYAVSDVIGKIKGKVAIRMFAKFPELRKKYWGSHFWSRGYFISTVGKNEEMIKEYIRNQDNLDRLNNHGKEI